MNRPRRRIEKGIDEVTSEEIQPFLRTLHQGQIDALRDRDSDFRAIFAELESHGLKQVKPSPGRAAL